MRCRNGGGNPPCVTATVHDFRFDVPIECVTPVVGPPNAPSFCNLQTTLNTLEAGFVSNEEFQRAVYQATEPVNLYDPGPDGQHHADHLG